LPCRRAARLLIGAQDSGSEQLHDDVSLAPFELALQIRYADFLVFAAFDIFLVLRAAQPGIERFLRIREIDR